MVPPAPPAGFEQRGGSASGGSRPDRYGFKDFKLKGGVLPGEQEIDTARALKSVSRMRASPSTLTALGCWMRPSRCVRAAGCSDLRRRSVRRRTGFLRPGGDDRVPPRHRAAGRHQYDSHNWREMGHAVMLNAVDIPLADPHFWTLSGAVRVAQLCDDWGSPGLPFQQPL